MAGPLDRRFGGLWVATRQDAPAPDGETSPSALNARIDAEPRGPIRWSSAEIFAPGSHSTTNMLSGSINEDNTSGWGSTMGRGPDIGKVGGKLAWVSEAAKAWSDGPDGNPFSSASGLFDYRSFSLGDAVVMSMSLHTNDAWKPAYTALLDQLAMRTGVSRQDMLTDLGQDLDPGRDEPASRTDTLVPAADAGPSVPAREAKTTPEHEESGDPLDRPAPAPEAPAAEADAPPADTARPVDARATELPQVTEAGPGSEAPGQVQDGPEALPPQTSSTMPDPEPEPEPLPAGGFVMPVVMDASEPPETRKDGQSPAEIEQTEIFTQPMALTDTGTEVVSGRVTTLSLGENVAAIELLSGPDHGNLTVNPDQSLALVLTGSEYVGALSFSARVTYEDGTTDVVEHGLTATEGLQAAGWGTGASHYMLQTAADGSLVVEHGENHRKVHISGSDAALSIEEIAAIEGITPDKIDGQWLAQNPVYGSSPEIPLDANAGMMLWYEITGRGEDASSDWLLFERGYEYEGTGRVIDRGTTGESELHPIYVGAYGEGADPVLHSKLNIYQEKSTNIVVEGLDFTRGVTALGGQNILLNDISVAGNEANIQNVDSFTLRNTDIIDAFRESTRSGTDKWEGHIDRISGIFVKNVEGLLIEDSLFDHNGWAEGYDYFLDASDPQAPSMYSHNVYIQADNWDVTLRDNVIMRGASFGAQVRSGGLIEGNAFIDNNAAVNTFGGNKNDSGWLGNYTLFLDNLVTSAGHKTVAAYEGAVARGVDNFGLDTTLIGNIVTHLADPNNQSEIEAKTETDGGFRSKDTYFNDTIVYNWVGFDRIDGWADRNQNTDSLDYNLLDQTTIQLFTAALTGNPDATIGDLATQLRGQADGHLDHVVDADLIVAFFQEAFQIVRGETAEAQELRFVPSDLGDGVRWDNRLNWTGGETPNPVGRDNIDLGGNWVQYGGTNMIGELDFGSGGRLNVSNGHLLVKDAIGVGAAGAMLSIERAGQVWTVDYHDTDLLTLTVTGGRFANIGTFAGDVDLTASGGQTLLGAGNARFELTAGSQMTISGSDVRIGFDGFAGDVATARFDAQAALSFAADAEGFATLGEFRSGIFDHDAAELLTGIDLGGVRLELDVTAITGPVENHILIAADEVMGEIGLLDVIGLSDSFDLILTTDYVADEVTLDVVAGTGEVLVRSNGTAEDISEENAAVASPLGLDPLSFEETLPIGAVDYLS